jgi:hypothetical protein
MKQIIFGLLAIFIAFSFAGADDLNFKISFSASVEQGPINGRLLLLISAAKDGEPRFQIADGASSQLVFGIDVSEMKPDSDIALNSGNSFGYPLQSLADLPAGEYRVQALLHRYETFNRADGHTLLLPMDRGEGQHWNRAPGNLYSKTISLKIDTASQASYELVMDQIIPPIPEPKDSKYIKHFKMQSDLLSEFWGRPMHLGAVLLLPEGYDEHADARYPLVIMHDHFNATIGGFSDSPPKADLAGRERSRAQNAYEFYQRWSGPDFPRVIVLLVQHANPFYDDSYAVNSANVGPYGDAIVHELLPEVDKRYRTIGQPWSRTMYGGSTGGWIVLAQQIFYPDDFNGAFSSCPDSVDFHNYQIVNIYDNKNAYTADSQWKKTPRPAQRNYLGEIKSTMAEQNHHELAIGNSSRSGGQWDIWEAAYSPVGGDGYPKRIWGKLTGEIDPEVAAYWRENYDLNYILQRDWETLGPKLVGKLNIWTGDMDSFHLNNAVYRLEKFLESTTAPYYGGSITYGDRKEHCWSTDAFDPKTGRRLTYHEKFIPIMVEHMLKTAPEGADVESWRY